MKWSEAQHLIGDGDLLGWTYTKWDSWYSLQVEAVRLETQSAFSHVSIARPMGLDLGLWHFESVEPVCRAIPVVNDLNENGFWWVRLNRPMASAELAFYLRHTGVTPYSKWGGIEAAVLGRDVTHDESWMECAKYAVMGRRLSGVDLGEKAIPAAVILAAEKLPGAEVIFVEP